VVQQYILMIPHIITDPIGMMDYEVELILDRVLIGYVFVKMVTESEICHIYMTVFLTI
jgi:hypothetical protein